MTFTPAPAPSLAPTAASTLPPSSPVSPTPSGASLALWTPSLLISALALTFTVASFWWLHARRGRLLSYVPMSYAAALPGRDLILVLPLVLHNTGPAPIAILDFRLFLAAIATPGQSEDPDSALPARLSWRAIQPELEPAKVGGDRRWPAPIPVPGRAIDRVFIEFGSRKPVLDPSAGPFLATVEVKLAHRPQEYQQLVRFELHTELASPDTYGAFITYTNDVNWEE